MQDNSTMSVSYLTLLPGHKIRLTAWGSGGKDFVRLFRGCWKQIPTKGRRAILAHWRSAGYEPCPVIELSNMWADSDTCFAQVTRRGMVLRFSAKDFATFPDSVARWIVAHELAHVYQKAIGRDPGGSSTKDNENEADEIAEGWGFNRMPRLVLGLLQQNRNLSVAEACKELAQMNMA